MKFPCGCMINEDVECAYCFEPICNKHDKAGVCVECFPKLSEFNAEGFLLHPTSRVRMCRCGLKWNQLCAQKTRFGSSMKVVDTTRVMQLATGEERRAAISNPAYWIIEKNSHGFGKWFS